MTVQTDSISYNPETDLDENHIWISDHNNIRWLKPKGWSLTVNQPIRPCYLWYKWYNNFVSTGPGKVPTQQLFFSQSLVIDPILSEYTGRYNIGPWTFSVWILIDALIHTVKSWTWNHVVQKTPISLSLWKVFLV